MSQGSAGHEGNPFAQIVAMMTDTVQGADQVLAAALADRDRRAAAAQQRQPEPARATPPASSTPPISQQHSTPNASRSLDALQAGLARATRDEPPAAAFSPHNPAAVHSAPANTSAATSPATTANSFLPKEPKTLEETGLEAQEIESLLLKALQQRGVSSGRQLAEQIRLPFGIVEVVLRELKARLEVIYRGQSSWNDYQYELSDTGAARARRVSERGAYAASAPVQLADYLEGLKQQSTRGTKPTLATLRNAFHELLLSGDILNQLGQALHAGRALFLYGPPGNGKTSIAERLTRILGEGLWIPRALSVHGEVIRLFDPSSHKELSRPNSSEAIDERWVYIRRPTVIVGGELTSDMLELRFDTVSGTSEAPLQLKSNGGTLVIDDFGRQRMGTRELLNRWIVPLEKGHDYLNMASGRKVQVPFDQLVVFSTNLEPTDLVDEAFLRRIPYKVRVDDPTEDEFRELFRRVSNELGVALDRAVLEYLLEHHYRAANRHRRHCQPRDLLRQVVNYCTFHQKPLQLTREAADAAVKNYFSSLNI